MLSAMDAPSVIIFKNPIITEDPVHVSVCEQSLGRRQEQEKISETGEL